MRLFSFSHLLLIAVAAIWGFAFVAQSKGMDHLGPHSFNAARFVFGALSLLPLWFVFSRHKIPDKRSLLVGGLLAGVILFCGFSFQQMGLQHTTAGNAGFITGMYIVFVPIAGMFLGHTTNFQVWCGVILAIVGLYFLSIGSDFSMNYGDILELIGAFFWTAHVIIIGWLSRKVDAISLSIAQFLVAALLATLVAIFLETPTLPDYEAALIPLLYAGVGSSGIAFTLQIIAQRKVSPSVSALILSLESVFAVLGGWLLLNEHVGGRELLGCSLMLAGMLASQWPERRKLRLSPVGQD